MKRSINPIILSLIKKTVALRKKCYLATGPDGVLDIYPEINKFSKEHKDRATHFSVLVNINSNTILISGWSFFPDGDEYGHFKQKLNFDDVDQEELLSSILKEYKKAVIEETKINMLNHMKINLDDWV